MIRGHDANIAALIAAARGGRMHHAWLLAGPEGIGKASFADMAARWLLAEGTGALPGDDLHVPDEHSTSRLLAAGSHPDHARLARLTKDKGELARNISVDQVRGLARLFATAPTFSARRAIVIDAMDDLEAAAANALLKNLEEPPPGAVFLLVAHAPARLLPTIRSRCRVLRFAPLADDAMTAALADALPEASPAELGDLVRTGGGAPGRALGYAGLEIGRMEAALDRIVRTGDPDRTQRLALARGFAGKAAQPRFEAFLDRLSSRIAQEARTRPGADGEAAIAAWEEARRIGGGAIRLSLDPQATAYTLAGLLASLAPAPATATPARR